MELKQRPLKFRALYERNGERIWINYRIDLDGTVQDHIEATDKQLSPWLQFTNMHDEDGREAYEGDVGPLTTNHPPAQNMEMTYAAGCWCLNKTDAAKLADCFTHRAANEDKQIRLRWRIIGNVYENPELLPARGN